ncbi:MAG: hypothetical protein QXI84_07575 [Thermofilaceae archaeon]
MVTISPRAGQVFEEGGWGERLELFLADLLAQILDPPRRVRALPKALRDVSGGG